MCCLGRFIRETHTGVVPVFAWRAWILPGTVPDLELRSLINGAIWGANQAVGHIFNGSLGVTRVPQQTAGAVCGQGKHISSELIQHISSELASLNGATWAPTRRSAPCVVKARMS
jgi:hypothetical protein